MCVKYSLEWQKELPCRFLDGLEVWNDDDFLPEGASKDYRHIFQNVYEKYFTQIRESDGFDIAIYPGKAKAAIYIPYLKFEEELDLLKDLADHAIEDYNLKKDDVYKYKFVRIETVNYIVAEHREFFMTVKVKNVTLRTPLETFRIHAYRGTDEKNVVVLCQRKMFPHEGVYRKQPLYFVRGSGMDCVHLTLPRPHFVGIHWAEEMAGRELPKLKPRLVLIDILIQWI